MRAALVQMQRSVVYETEITAPRERVFQAWTDPSEVVKWWGDDEYYRMQRADIDARADGDWIVCGVFHSSKKPFTISGKYLRAEPPKGWLFTWNQSWLPGVSTAVEFFLLDLGGRTLVRVRHIGDPNDDLAESHRSGWERVLGWMKAYLEREA